MALTGPRPCSTSILGYLPTQQSSLISTYRLHLAAIPPARTRVRHALRGHAALATRVAAPERPAGYVQRPRRKTNKHVDNGNGANIQQDAAEQLQQLLRPHQSAQLPSASTVDGAACTLRDEQQLLEAWQQQQQRLQQQWQQQQQLHSEVEQQQLQPPEQQQHLQQSPHVEKQREPQHQQQQLLPQLSSKQEQYQQQTPRLQQQRQTRQQQRMPGQQDLLKQPPNGERQKQHRQLQQTGLQDPQQLMQQQQQQQRQQQYQSHKRAKQKHKQQEQQQLVHSQQQGQLHWWQQRQQQHPHGVLQQRQQGLQQQQQGRQSLLQQQIEQEGWAQPQRIVQQLPQQQQQFGWQHQQGPGQPQQHQHRPYGAQQQRPQQQVHRSQQQQQQQQQQPSVRQQQAWSQGQLQQQQMTAHRLVPHQQQQHRQLPQHYQSIVQQHTHNSSSSSSSNGYSVAHPASSVGSVQQQQQHLPSSSATSSNMAQASAAAAAGGGAYAIVPAATAPSVAAAAARAAALSAARAAASTAAASDSSSSSSSGVRLPPAEQCVPEQFWGLMREELRPWHKQVLVHLCYCLPPPACYIYRDMRAGTMQGVLARRAMFEKAVRSCFVDLVWQQQRLRRWLDMVSRKQPDYVNPGNVLQAQKEILELKAAIGRTKAQLQSLQAQGRTYSDSDYVQYSTQFEPLLRQMDEICDTAREEQVGLILDVQSLRDNASRKALYTRRSAENGQTDTDKFIQQKLAEQQLIWKLVKKQMWGMKHKMCGPQGLNSGSDSDQESRIDRPDSSEVVEWRYPPSQHILWRFKGRVGASRPPLVLPGLRRQMPKARQNVEQA